MPAGPASRRRAPPRRCSTPHWSDPDNDHQKMHFVAVDIPAGMTFVNIGGDQTTVHWVPTFSQIGSHPVTIGISDGYGGYAQETWTIDVQRPVIPIGGVK